MNEGWIKAFRSLRKWRWYKDHITKSVFIDLLLSVNIVDCDFENITVHRGQVVTSYNSIAEANGISYQQARTAIKKLKTTGEIIVTRHPKFSVISIVNYDLYQGEPTVNQQGENGVFPKKKRNPTESATESSTGSTEGESTCTAKDTRKPKSRGQQGQQQGKEQSVNSQSTVSQQQYKNDKERKNYNCVFSADKHISFGDCEQ